MLDLAAYLHRLDPFAWRISGDFGIRWYGLAYAAGFVCLYVFAMQLAKRRRIAMTTEQVGDFVMYAVAGVLLGGRLGWVLFYHPAALWSFTPDAPWWEVLAINRGGMASHGGMLGVIIAMYIFSRRNNVDPFALLDVSALLVPFGLFFGRLANFVNGELRGQPCDPSFPLAVKFPQEIVEDWGVAQFREAHGLSSYFNIPPLRWEEFLNAVENGSHDAIVRFSQYQQDLLAAVRAGNKQVISIVEPLLIARHPSQLYQAFAEGIVLGTVLCFIFFVIRPKRHGIVGCWFLIVYGILRIMTEIWRVPDEGIDRVMGLSRGQWLSVAMIVAGLGALAYVMRRPTPDQVSPAEPQPR